MASASGEYDTARLIATVKILKGKELKPILRDLNLPVSGSKAHMQERLLDKIHAVAAARNTLEYNRVKKFILPEAPTFAQQPHSPKTSSSHSGQQVSTPSYTSYAGSYNNMPPRAGNLNQWPAGHLNFKDSPFFTVLEPLSQVLECKVREQTRDSLVVRLPLEEKHVQRIQADPHVRVMLYCAGDNNGLNPFTKNDIEFPHQVELKVNLDEVKANLRGLKKKPGSTRPADLTTYLRKVPKYENEIRLTFQGGHAKKFYVIVNLVQKHEAQELIDKLKRSERTISREQVLREMKSKAQDPDITTTSTVMSLKCPLSTLRIDVPCRTVVCSHNQCFDASAFLQLQEQAPTWSCPVCNRSTSFDGLVIDQYVNDILQRTSRSVEQVTIEPDGTWSETTAGDNSQLPNGAAYTPDADDDIVEIPDIRVNSLKREAPSNSPFHRTPPTSSREQSTSSSIRPPSSNKRPASDVIDLTLSDDDDDLAPPPNKRPSYEPSSTSGGLSLRNGYRETSTGSNLSLGAVSFGIPSSVGRSLYPNNSFGRQ